MAQLTFSDAECAGKHKQTRREVFLAEMDQVVPWAALLGLIEPHYPKAGRGRRPYPLETMLRLHFLQQWYALSDPAMEEALYEIAPLRQFARLSLLDAIPDEATLLNFRHLLERHSLAAQTLTAVNTDLCKRGLLLRQGTMWTPRSSTRPVRPKKQWHARSGDAPDQEGQPVVLRPESAHRRGP